MLRINLLPAYIAEQRKVRIAIVLAAILFLVATAVPLLYYFLTLSPQIAQMKAEDEDMTAKAQTETELETKITSTLQGIAPIADKVAFVQDVVFHNEIRQKIFRNAAKYTYRSVEYNAMSVTGNTLSLNATVSNLDDIGRFYLTMFGNPDVSAVSIAGVPDRNYYLKAQPIIVPGGAPPAPPQYAIAMNATLTHSVVTPTLPASLLAAPAGGVAGGGGAAGGLSVGGGLSMPSGGPPPGGGMAPPSGGPGMAPPSGGPMVRN